MRKKDQLSRVTVESEIGSRNDATFALKTNSCDDYNGSVLDLTSSPTDLNATSFEVESEHDLESPLQLMPLPMDLTSPLMSESTSTEKNKPIEVDILKFAKRTKAKEQLSVGDWIEYTAPVSNARPQH